MLAQTASDSYPRRDPVGHRCGGVSFLVASLLLKTDRTDAQQDLAAATAEMEAMKGKPSAVAAALTGGAGRISSIVFACDADMGSSAMGASVPRKKIHGSWLRRRQGHQPVDRQLTDTTARWVAA